jgi:hypothetical protein
MPEMKFQDILMRILLVKGFGYAEPFGAYIFNSSFIGRLLFPVEKHIGKEE